MYPGYKRPQDVLNEYAIVYFALLNEGYRQRNQDYLMLANITAIPRMESESANKFLKQLEWAAREPGDILKPSENAATTEQLKKFFGNI